MPLSSHSLIFCSTNASESPTGVAFDPALASTFSQNELMQVAQALGEFLSALHSFSLHEARNLEVDEMDPTEFWAYMEQNPNAYPHYQATVFPHLTQNEQQWVAELFEAYITQIRATPFATCMTHNDIWLFHIIVNPTTHTLSGVIDFGLRIADAACDFKAFEHYGQDFVAEVYRHYHAPIDEHFEQRRLFYTAHDLVFEFARALTRDDPQQIAQCQQALSTYIATHSR